MQSTVAAVFENRRDAEMAVEKLLQEYDLDPIAVRIFPEHDENSAGIERSGSDMGTSSDQTHRPKLAGCLIVEVTVASGSAVEIEASLRATGGVLKA